MRSSDSWQIPPEFQPDPRSLDYDLDQVLSSLVSLRATVPADAFTAESLGTERLGQGVVIRDDGLVLTIGYLITEADQIWLTAANGRAVGTRWLMTTPPVSGLFRPWLPLVCPPC